MDWSKQHIIYCQQNWSFSRCLAMQKIFDVNFRMGLYLGWFPVVTALCCSNFVYFYTYNSLKTKFIQGKKSSALTDLSLAFISGSWWRPIFWLMALFLFFTSSYLLFLLLLMCACIQYFWKTLKQHNLFLFVWNLTGIFSLA